MRPIKQLRLYWADTWRRSLIILVSILGVGSLFWFRLSSLTGGRSTQEVASNYHLTFHGILANPVNAPYSLGLYVLQKLHHTGLLEVRSLSALAGLTALVFFYIVLRRWYTKRMALLGIILFGTSTWFLQTARFASPDVLLLVLPALLICGVWLRDTERRALATLLMVVMGSVLLYIPGLIWFVMACIIWQNGLLRREFKEIKPIVLLAYILLGGLLLTPLVWALVHTPSLIKPLLGLPSAWPGLRQAAQNLVSVPQYLFIRGPSNPSLWLGHLPLLDIFSSAMFFLGLYAYYLRWRINQGRLLLGILVIGSLLVALGGSVSITVLLPFVYIVMTAGVALLLQQWLTVFPRNPLAKRAGMILVVTAVVAASFYQLNRYFVAWPHAPATKQAFSIKN